MIDDIRKDADIRMDKSVAALAQALKKLRTGRAHPSLLEHIHADYYGSSVPLNQMCGAKGTVTKTFWFGESG